MREDRFTDQRPSAPSLSSPQTLHRAADYSTQDRRGGVSIHCGSLPRHCSVQRTSLTGATTLKDASHIRATLGKSWKCLAEGRRFELRNPVWGHGFQDDSALIPNPTSFLCSQRVRSLLASADVGPDGALLGARGHRMGTPEKIRSLVARRGCALRPTFGPTD